MRRFEKKADVDKAVLVIAKRVLENVNAGRTYPAGNVEWAREVVGRLGADLATTPPVAPARAQEFER